jgi:hypothetical protein
MARTKLNSDLTQAVGVAAGKVAPPAGIVGLAAVGAIDMTFFVGIVTIGYIVLQAAYLIWKWNKERRESKKFLASMGLPPDEK